MEPDPDEPIEEQQIASLPFAKDQHEVPMRSSMRSRPLGADCIVLAICGGFLILGGANLAEFIFGSTKFQGYYLIFGNIANLLIGAALSIADRRYSKQSSPRLVFYSFTAPTVFLVIILIISLFP